MTRQYCGALGKIANCQVAVTAALWTGHQAWLLGAQMFLPEGWLTPAQRQRASIPPQVTYQERWRLALTLVRQIRAARFTLTAVLADAEYGDCATFRRALHRWRLPYAVGISSPTTVFLGTPPSVAPAPLVGLGRPRVRRVLRPTRGPSRSRRSSPLNRPAPGGRSVAQRHQSRVAGVVSRRSGSPLPTTGGGGGWPPRSGCWPNAISARRRAPSTTSSICRRPHRCGRSSTSRTSAGPSSSSTRNSKTNSGSIISKGARCPAGTARWSSTALAYAFLQGERTRRQHRGLTLPKVRAVIQDILSAHYLLTHPRQKKWMLDLRKVELRF